MKLLLNFPVLILLLHFGLPGLSPAALAESLRQSTVDFADYNNCGATSLYLLLSFIDDSVSPDSVRESLGPPTEGLTHSVTQLQSAAASHGIQTIALGNVDAGSIPTPCIAHFSQSPFRVSPYNTAPPFCGRIERFSQGSCYFGPALPYGEIFDREV